MIWHICWAQTSETNICFNLCNSSINKGFRRKPVLAFRFMYCADFYEWKCHFSDHFLHNVHANFKISHNMTPEFGKLILWFYCFLKFPQPWLSKLNWKLQRSKNVCSLSMAHCSFQKLWYFFSTNAVCSFNDDFAELDLIKAEKFWQASQFEQG